MTQTLSNLPMRAQSYDDPFIEALYKGSETSDTIDRLETIRPWGSYRRIDIGYRYQVKQITVSRRASCMKAITSSFKRAKFIAAPIPEKFRSF
jgi:hypothetical protein